MIYVSMSKCKIFNLFHTLAAFAIWSVHLACPEVDAYKSATCKYAVSLVLLPLRWATRRG